MSHSPDDCPKRPDGEYRGIKRGAYLIRFCNKCWGRGPMWGDHISGPDRVGRQTHHLKTWPSYFQTVIDGVKTFEVRVDDRDFEAGDTIILEEYLPNIKKYTGRKFRFIAGTIFRSSKYLQKDVCVISILRKDS